MMNHERHMEFHRLQGAAHQRLIEALFTCIPPDWKEARLLLDVAFAPQFGTRSVQHELSNPTTGQQITDFPESLFKAATELHVVFSQYEQAWKRAIVDLKSSPAGRCRKVESRYEYGPPS